MNSKAQAFTLYEAFPNPSKGGESKTKHYKMGSDMVNFNNYMQAVLRHLK